MEVLKKHKHMEECADFASAVNFGIIGVIGGEPMILGKLPADAKIGNVLTKEDYDPKEFALNYVVTYCPFCGLEIYEPIEEDDYEMQDL